MEKLVLDGKVYVRAATAAEELGYTRDYIGQLCRSGKVDAHLVGRSWYVDQSQLRIHKREKKRSTKAKAKEQVKQSLAEEKNDAENAKAYKSRITYETDDEELIPKVKKLAVNEKEEAETKKDTKAAKKKEQKKKDDEPAYTFENEGQKTVMSGTLEVTSADEEESLLDDGATVMRAKVIEETDTKEDKKTDSDTRFAKENKDISDTNTKVKSVDGASQKAPQKKSARKSFREKLALLEEEERESRDEASDEQQTKRVRSESQSKNSSGDPQEAHKKHAEHTEEAAATDQPPRLWPAHLGIILTIAVAFTLVGLESHWSYDAARADKPSELVQTTYTLTFEPVKNRFR